VYVHLCIYSCVLIVYPLCSLIVGAVCFYILAVIYGNNFGPADEFITKVTYGPYGTNYVARNCTIKVASTQIMCLTAPGIGRNHRWTVSIRTQTNSFQNNEPETSYMLPVVTAITPSQGITNGGTEITITGHHFGAVDVDSNPGVAVYFSDFSTTMLGCKTYEVRRGRNNPTQPNPSVSNNNETITFLLPEYHTAGHPIKVAIGAGACPPEACADCPSLLRYESQLTDDSTLSYKPPKISLIQIRSFPNATTVKTGDTTLTDKLLILEGENFCADEECGAVWMGALKGADGVESPRIVTRNGQEINVKTPCPQYSGPNAPHCMYTHNKIVLVTSAKSGTVWVTAGKVSPATLANPNPLPQETNVAVLRPPKQFRFVSPEISEQNKTDLNSLTFDTAGGCLVYIYGQYFGQLESELCVTVGHCIPRPVCGQPCLDPTTGEIVGRSVPITPGSLRGPFEDENGQPETGQFSFTVPPGQGNFNDFFVWRGDQASINDFVRPTSPLREFALNYKRVGDATSRAGQCDDPVFVLPPDAIGRTTADGNCDFLLHSCKKSTSAGYFCILPSCYSDSVPVLKFAGTDSVVKNIPTSGLYVDIESTQLGELTDNTGTAPPNSKIHFGAFYEEVQVGFGGQGCLTVGCDWLLSANQNQPKCGCLYPNLGTQAPNLWSSKNPLNKAKTWTDTKITNVYIPPGTGKGYKLQIVVNGVPSAPIEVNYAAPVIESITDAQGKSSPAYSGTEGNTLLTIVGLNFGCNPTAGTIDPWGEIPDGLLTPTELLAIYNQDTRTVDDLLLDFDTSYDESIKFPTDLNKQRQKRIQAANGISRQEFDKWQRRDKATPAFVGTSQFVDLCQGPPIILLKTATEHFPCPVLTLTDTSLTCNASAGEGKMLDVSLLPAGSNWKIAPSYLGTGVASPETLASEENVLVGSFSYNIPQIFSIETTIPGTDCLRQFGHACGPSSARLRVPVGLNSSTLHANNGGAGRRRRRLVGDTVPSNNGTVLKPVQVTIKGSNFGRSTGAPVKIQLLCEEGAKFCQGQEITLDATTVVRAQRQITLHLSPGVGENLAVRITVAGQVNTINAGGRFSYLAPTITAVYPDYGSTLQHVTKLDREDGRFFHRRFTDGDVNADGVLTRLELRELLSASEALRGVIDLTARDADFTFNALDFDQSEWCLSVTCITC